ncbi:MAG TPA: hypothetical protein PKH07_02235 [bacterium]|nr:hypothetical protein [bacterium]
MDCPSSLIVYDEKTVWRCPKLGGSVPFKYCRTLLQGMPCPSVQSCWENLIAITDFLEQNYSAEKLERVWKEQPKAPKVDQLFDLIQKAKDVQSRNR